MITKFFFGAAVMATAAMFWVRLTTWTGPVLQPETDIPLLCLLGILAHFAFQKPGVGLPQAK